MHDLLLQHSSGKISLADLEKECAYWFMDCLSEVRVKAYPTPPAEYAEYEQMTLKEKSKIPPDFWHQGNIKNYVDQRSRIHAENYSNLQNLKDHKKNIPAEDSVANQKFQEHINDFEERLKYVL